MQAEKLRTDLKQLTVYQVIDQFLDSEQQYSRQLRVLNEFERRLRCHFDSEDYILNIEDIDAIFIQTGSLFNFTRDLVETLNKKRWDGPEIFLGEVGDMLVKNMQFFKMYGQYNQDLKSAVEKFAYLMENSNKFKRWVDFNETCAQLQPGGFLPLLKLPQQHFLTYIVFLEAIVVTLAQLSTSHPATASIANAFQKFSQVLDDINVKAENTMRINRVVEIQKLFFKDSIVLVEASRKWYRTSKIKIKDAKESKKQVDAQLFLFNDCIIYGTPNFFGSGYSLVGVMAIAGLEILPLHSVQHSFKLTSSLNNREWEITCVSNETPDQRRLENKETAERSYHQWLGALLKVYKLYYNIQDGSRQNSGASAALSPRFTHPEDTESMMKKKNVPTPRQIEKPAVSAQSPAQAEFDRLQAARAAQGNATSPTEQPRPQQPTSQPQQPPQQTPPSVQISSEPSSQPHVPQTPRRAPMPTPVVRLTDDEIHASIKEGTKFDDWEKVFDESSGQFYYENLVLQETTWDPPQGFIDHFEKLRKENDDAVAASQQQQQAVPPQTPRPPQQPPMTPSHPQPPSQPQQPPGMPPSQPQPQPPAQPPGMPPAQPPAQPPGMPPAGPPSGPPGGPPGRGGLLSAIQGGAQLRKTSEPKPPASGPPKGGLLAGIQGGVQLKKAEIVEKPAQPEPTTVAGGFAPDLMASLASYRKFVQDDDDNNNDDDDDW